MNVNQTISAKITGRENALKLLQAQLISGMRPTKGIKPFKYKIYDNPVWSYDKTAVEHTKSGIPVKLEELPLTVEDRTRIQLQINSPERKILYAQDYNSLKVIPRYKRKTKHISRTVKSGNLMRPKNKKTKLFQLIDGIYCKITGKK